jgi:hypothetical protein
MLQSKQSQLRIKMIETIEKGDFYHIFVNAINIHTYLFDYYEKI